MKEYFIVQIRDKDRKNKFREWFDYHDFSSSEDAINFVESWQKDRKDEVRAIKRTIIEEEIN